MPIPAVAHASSLSRRLLRGLRLFTAAALLVLGGTAAADNLTSVASGTLAPLPAEAAQPRLLVVDGRDLALSADGAWTLAGDGKAWQPLQLGREQLVGLEQHVFADPDLAEVVEQRRVAQLPLLDRRKSELTVGAGGALQAP